MKDFIFTSIPWLLAAPLSVFVISAVCSCFKSRILSVLSIILHVAAICALIFLGGGLSDVFVTLLMSVLASMIFSKKSTERHIKGEGDER